jgi:hypothetical protein
MSRWAEAFATLSRSGDNADTNDTTPRRHPLGRTFVSCVSIVSPWPGGDREAGTLPGEQPPVVQLPANDARVPPDAPAAIGAVATRVCPGCGARGRWAPHTPGPSPGWTCWACVTEARDAARFDPRRRGGHAAPTGRRDTQRNRSEQ